MRVGLVGCGLIGRRRAQVLREISDDVLVAVADIHRDRAAALAQEMGCEIATSWEDVTGRDDVEIVVVSTTNNWLGPISVAALRHGKHVLVEKPMSRTLAEAEQVMRAAAASPGTVVKVGFNHRHHAAVRKARELVAAEAIGEILFVRCRYGHGGRPGYEREWRLDPEVSGGGELLDQGIHAIDLFRWFLGELTEAVGFAAGYVWVPPLREADGRGSRAAVDDNAFALFRTAAGQIASLHASWTQWKNLFSFEIFGREGYLIAEGLGGSYGPERLTVGRRKTAGGAPEEQTMEFPPTDVSWREEWREFTAAIRERRQPLGSGHDGLQALRLVHAVYESARAGKVVRL